MLAPDTSGITAHELEIINCIAARVCRKYAFPGVGVEDVRQQALLFGLDALKRYNPERGALENFLANHIKRRLLNYKRDHYRRSECPCVRCRSCEDEARDVDHHADGQFCQMYKNWAERNRRKVLLSTSMINDKEASRFVQDDGIENVDVADVLEYIAKQLTDEQRTLWHRIRTGEKGISSEKKRRIEKIVLDIVSGAGLELALPS